VPAIDEDDKPKKKVMHEIGQDLSLLSIEELNARIQLMHDEITRLEAAHHARPPISSSSARNPIFSIVCHRLTCR
jgi:uncharacterized small protein (DUF1192 family)